MSNSFTVLWLLGSLLIAVTEQKLKTTIFRTLPMQRDKLTIAELPSYNLFEPNGPGTYAFGYEIEDKASNNIQFRDEEKLQNGTVRGSYGLVRPNGLVSITRYFADDSGYHSSSQTFSQHDKKPTLLTSTESPFLQMSSPSDVMFLDVPNPATISPQVAQQILEQHKIDLLTPSSNIPITDIFSSADDSDSDTSESSSQNNKMEKPLAIFQELIPSSHVPQLSSSMLLGNPSQGGNKNEKKVTSLPGHISNPISGDGPKVPSHSSELFQEMNLLQPLAGSHIPKIPEISRTTQSPAQLITSDINQNSPQSTHTNKPSSDTPQIPNIFENILSHIPKLPVSASMITTSTSTPLSSSESPSSSTEATKPMSDVPQIPNIFENILPHIPQLPVSSSMVTTPTVTPSTETSSLADEKETDTSISPEVTENKPSSLGTGLPSLSSIFGFLDPSKIPIFQFPSNLLPNRQDNSETPTTETITSPTMEPAMDTIFQTQNPTIEPIFAIIHKNATVAPVYDDDGNTVGVQLVNNFIPSNFHIIPFIVPSNLLLQSAPTQSPNIAHDEVVFEDGIPYVVTNDKFHDPLEDLDPTWKSRRKPNRKRKYQKRNKNRRNSNKRTRYRNGY